MIGVILAAGKGIRFSKSIGKDTCKSLVKIEDRNLLSFSLDNLVTASINEAVIVVGENGDEIIDVYGDKYKSVCLKYVVQENPIGLANAFYNAVKFCEDDVVLQLSDELFINLEIVSVIEKFNENKNDFILTYTEEPDFEKLRLNFSIQLSGDTVEHCVEKPTKPVNNLKGSGLCVFNRGCVKCFVSNYSVDTNYPDTLCDCINDLINNGKTGFAMPVADEEININTYDDYIYALERFTKEV